MTATSEDRNREWAYRYVAIGLVACSMLTFEILLTRLCALRLYFHFAFLVVSNCLLGIGASGSVLALFQEVWRKRQRAYLARFCALYLVSVVTTYVVLLLYPLPTRLWESLRFEELDRLLLVLAGFNLLVALPMFFGGLVIGMLLTFGAERVNRLYAVDLIGAGLGCLLCPLFLAEWGAGGVLVLVALLALAATVVAVPRPWRKPALAVGVVLAVLGLAVLPVLDAKFPVPNKSSIELTPNVSTPTGEVDSYSKWSATSRIDLIKVPANRRYVFTLGENRRGLPPIPEQKLILQDSSSGTFIANWSEHPERLKILDRSMYTAAVRLKDRPRVFIIGLGGGNDVWAAKLHGASHVKAIELHRSIVDIHEKILPRFSRGLLEDPTVELVYGEGRSALMRESDTYDVVQMTAIDTWAALASGAYVLAENYLYTREAIETMYSRLAEDGILQITRLAADAEVLRLLSNVHAALGGEDLSRRILALATADHQLAVLVKKGTFSEAEVAEIERYAEESGIRQVYLPGRELGGAVEEFIRTSEKQRFIEEYPFDITPTSDDEPYFFNFYRWQNLLAARSKVLENPSISQGNPFLILSQLALAVVFSVVLILLPLTRLGKIPRRGVGRYLVYFSGMGLGFIAIEIALMQKLTLFLGHPLYSITVTLFTILVFSGLGSLLLSGRFSTTSRRIWIVPLGILVCVAGAALYSPQLVAALIHLPLAARFAVTVGLLAPLSMLLGVPFAYGVRLLDERRPEIIPWAWAVNGCLSVVGSVLTVVVSMNLGFAAVLWGAGAVYVIAFAALRRELVTS